MFHLDGIRVQSSLHCDEITVPHLRCQGFQGSSQYEIVESVFPSSLNNYMFWMLTYFPLCTWSLSFFSSPKKVFRNFLNTFHACFKLSLFWFQIIHLWNFSNIWNDVNIFLPDSPGNLLNIIFICIWNTPFLLTEPLQIAYSISLLCSTVVAILWEEKTNFAELCFWFQVLIYYVTTSS